MDFNFFSLLNVFTITFLIFNTFLFLKSFIKFGRAFKVLSCYLFFVSLIQLATIFVAKILHKPNLFLSHFYFISQFIILSIFYRILLKNKFILYLLLPIFGVLTYQYIDDPDIFFRYHAIGISITQSILIVYAIVYLYRCLQGENLFLIVNVGLFLYLVSSTLIFASGNLIFNLNISDSMNFLLINTNRILYFLFQILIFIEWRKNYYKKIPKS